MDNLIVDMFSGDAFTTLNLTAAINNVPVTYGRLNQMGLFTEKGIDTTVFSLEFANGVINLIPSSKRGTAAPKNKTGKRTLKHFDIPRIALDDIILPSDIQNKRQFGKNELETPVIATNDKLVALARKHDLTNEYLKCGAIAGIITDADGTTLLNLFTEFGVSEQTQDFDFTDEAADINALTQEVSGMIEDNLDGDTMTHVHALCSPDAWKGFISHPSVKEAYAHYMAVEQALAGYAGAAANPLRNDVRKGFNFGGAVWEEYRGKATYQNGDSVVTRNFVEAGKIRFFPVGTQETFIQSNAPADWMETVNTVGLPKYAKVVPEAGGRHVEVLSQSAPLPICVRPKVLVKGNCTLS